MPEHSTGVQRLRRCPKCGAITERVSHCFVKGPPLFPQMDDYTATEPCNVIEAKVTDGMIERALDGCGRAGGEMGPVRMRAALEAAFRCP